MNSILNNIPPVTKNLLLINVALYILMLVFDNMGGIDLTNLLSTHYVGTPFFKPYQIVTHMFMHSNRMFFHILFNMLLLVMFGSQLERLWGAKHYFIFYISCGLGAFALDNIIHGIEIFRLREVLQSMDVNMLRLDNLIENFRVYDESEMLAAQNKVFNGGGVPVEAQKYFNLSVTSGVGASGAIFGLLAAFAILFPNTELMLLFLPVPIKAKYLIGVYVLYEVYQAINPSGGDVVNHWAHIGGALVGTIIVLIRRKTNKENFY